MKLFVAEYAGYCFGVQRAMDIIDKAQAVTEGPVFTLGPIIHNSRVVSSLEQRGIMPAVGVDQDFPPGACVILPSHGTPPPVVEKLKLRGVKVIDAACPRVLAVHKRVRRALAQSRTVFLAGDPGHTETAASAAIDPAHTHVVSTPDDVHRIDPSGEPAFLAAQTTFSRTVFREVRSELSRRIQDLDVFDSICSHTRHAQNAAAALAAQCDVMIIAGGRKSANTRRLREVCRAAGVRVRCVEAASELRRAMFRQTDRVGITAGASTPCAHIHEIKDWLCARFEID